MERHEFDGVSFFFGLVFVTLASWVLVTEGRLDFDARWVWPVLLVVGGVALLVPTFRRREAAEPELASAPDGGASTGAGTTEGLEQARAELPPDPFDTRT